MGGRATQLINQNIHTYVCTRLFIEREKPIGLYTLLIVHAFACLSDTREIDDLHTHTHTPTHTPPPSGGYMHAQLHGVLIISNSIYTCITLKHGFFFVCFFFCDVHTAQIPGCSVRYVAAVVVSHVRLRGSEQENSRTKTEWPQRFYF